MGRIRHFVGTRQSGFHPIIRKFVSYFGALFFPVIGNAISMILNVRFFNTVYIVKLSCKNEEYTPCASFSILFYIPLQYQKSLDMYMYFTLGLSCVLMLRPMSPELVLFPNFWVSNIPRYFYFTCYTLKSKKVNTNSSKYSKGSSKNEIPVYKRCTVFPWQQDAFVKHWCPLRQQVLDGHFGIN